LRNQEYQQYERRQMFAGVWVRLVHTLRIVKSIADKFNEKKSEQILKQKVDYCVRKIARNFKKIYSHKGATLDNRLACNSAMGISFFHISIKDTLTSKAQLVMHDFMDKALLIKKLKDRMLGCRKLISK